MQYTIPFIFSHPKMTTIAAQTCLLYFRENTTMAVLARSQCLSKSSACGLFYNLYRYSYEILPSSSTIYINEFSAKTNEGTFAFGK